MQEKVDTDAMRRTAGTFDTYSSDAKEYLGAFQSATMPLEGAHVVGSGAAATAYTETETDFVANVVQLVSSLSTIAAKMRLSASYYDQTEQSAQP